MGNCQANDAAAAVIQHPDGSILRLYWPTTVDEVMRNYPGHYVAQVTLCISNGNPRDAANPVTSAGGGAAVANFRFTRVRLLKHKDLLLIGHVYRLITSQEVTEALKARKHARIKKVQAEIGTKQKQQQQQSSIVQIGVDSSQGNAQIDSQKMDQEVKYEKQRQKSSRCWQPSLQSISELGA